MVVCFVKMFVCMQESSDRGKEIEYVMKRLIRGLASSRECARLGFSTVLTHVGDDTCFDFESVLTFVALFLDVIYCSSQ